MAPGLFGGIFGSTHAVSETKKPFADDDPVVLSRDDVADFNECNILPQSTETLDDIRKWLRTTEYDGEASEYGKHLSSHLPGTGQWLLSSSIFRQWHSGDQHGLLWIRGMNRRTQIRSCSSG